MCAPLYNCAYVLIHKEVFAYRLFVNGCAPCARSGGGLPNSYNARGEVSACATSCSFGVALVSNSFLLLLVRHLLLLAWHLFLLIHVQSECSLHFRCTDVRKMQHGAGIGLAFAGGPAHATFIPRTLLTTYCIRRASHGNPQVAEKCM